MTSQARPGSSPTVRRRRLGAELRRLREAAGLSAEEAARHLECSPSKLSRVETGRTPARRRDVRDLLELYGVADPARRAGLLELVRLSSEQGWWQSYGDVVPDWLVAYIGFEGEASCIRTYESLLVPGLLQTERYADALLRSSDRPVADTDVARMVALRSERQRRVEGSRDDRRVDYQAVIDEAALRRPVGGAEVMRGQLEHLLDAGRRDSVTIRVIPYGVGGYPAQGFPFTLFDFPRTGDPAVVYVEELTGALYLEKSYEVRRYRVAFDYLRARALDHEEATALIIDILKDME